jgi:HPt (histidine-containing phosphotransfer) domain-containing protein
MADDECDFDNLESVLRYTRRHFIDSFAENCRSIEELWHRAAVDGDTSVLPALQRRVHQLAGLAGTIGFPTVSNRGAALDRLLARWAKTGDGAADVPGAVAMIREAFDEDLARLPPD